MKDLFFAFLGLLIVSTIYSLGTPEYDIYNDNFYNDVSEIHERNQKIIYIENNTLKYFIKLASNESHEIQPHHTLFEYNKTGEVIKEMHYWREGRIDRIITETIEYDEKNNWIYFKQIDLDKYDSEGNNVIYEFDRKIIYK
jgi:hypothetical protein